VRALWLAWWQFPFDDEIYTLSMIEPYSAAQLLTTCPKGSDVHLLLSYPLFLWAA
jgi:hypothetical protein